VACIKAGRATSALIRRDPSKSFATGEQHWTFKALHQKTQIIATDTRPTGKLSVARVSGRLLGEESDHYPVIAQLNDRWRVIACKNSIQWILQRRRGGVDHWRGYWFCRTREALLRGAREHASPIDGVALAVLLRLP
jgi:hypothetical protein